MFRRTTLVAALALCTSFACGDKEKSSDESGSSSSAGSTKIIDGKAPAMPPAFTGLNFGMDEATAKQAMPALFEDEVSVYGSSRVARGDLADKSASVTFAFGKLTKVELSGLPQSDVDTAKKLWGEPTTVTMGASNKSAMLWFDETNGIRTTLMLGLMDEDFDLTVEPYLSFTQLASLDKDRILAPRAVLNADDATLLKAFPHNVVLAKRSESSEKATAAMMKGMKDDLKKMGVDPTAKTDTPDLDARLPPTAFDDGDTSVLLMFNKNNRVRSMMTKVDGNDAIALGKEITTAFDKSWGPAKLLDRTQGKTHTWYDVKGGIRISAHIGGKFGVSLDAVRYLPLSELFGEPGVKWGFETTTLLGASLEEVKTAYPDSYVPYEERGSLQLPTTEYDDNVSTTNINFHMTDEGKIRSYYFTLEHEAYDGGKAEIEALFKAKFGEPEVDKRGRLIFSKANPSIIVRDSDITHSFHVEVE